MALTADDAELPVFVAKLRDAVQASGLLSPPVVETLRSATGSVSDNEYADSLASLVAAAATADVTSDPAAAALIPAVVLDGFDVIPASSATARFVEALSRQAPSSFRLIISSRSPMPFAIDRLRETGRLSELTNDDLVFDVDETYQLLTIALGDAAEADEIASDLHTLSAGWPSQISLGAAWLGQLKPNGRKSRLAAFDGFDGQLDELVLKSAPRAVRSLVRLAAYLPRVNASLLADIGQDADGLEERLSTCAPMLMPESGRPGWHRISAAAKSAVFATDPLPLSERRAAQRAAGWWFSHHRELDSAISTAIELGRSGIRDRSAGAAWRGSDLVRTHR